MKIIIQTSAQTAARLGLPTFGLRTIEVPAQELCDMERECLARLLDDRGNLHTPAIGDGSDLGRYDQLADIAGDDVAAVVEYLRRVMQDCAAAREREAERQRERQERDRVYEEKLRKQKEQLRKLPIEDLLFRPTYPRDKTRSGFYRDSVQLSDGTYLNRTDWPADVLERVQAAAEALRIETLAHLDEIERQNAEAEKVWISEHGSERLKRAFAEGIEHNRILLDEWIFHECPGWVWYQDVEWQVQDPRNPPVAAFELLDRARMEHPSATLHYWRDGHDTGYCAIAEVTVPGESETREIVLVVNN